MFKNHVSHKGLVHRIYKELLQLKIKTQTQNEEKIQVDIFSKNIHKYPIKIREKILNIISHKANADQNPIT